MSTRRYVLPVEETSWQIPTGSTVVFSWEYDEGRDKLLSLYEKGKDMQWNAARRIDWSHAIDPDNPFAVPDQLNPLYGSRIWERLDERGRVELRRHAASWQISQFLHGEQGALACTARIVESVPQMDAKFYAATQVMDEARHVETYARFLREKMELTYPINPHLKTLLNQVLSDGRWDIVYLGMQILIEGLALGAFNLIRDMVGDPLVRSITAYVMQDEARHVAFGRQALRDHYPQLTQKERDEREEFVVEACYLMRDRFRGEEVYGALGFDVAECVEHVERSFVMSEYRRMLFSRIVPTIKDIGLWGERVRKAYEDMGVMGFESLDPEALGNADEVIALQIDEARRAVAEAE